MVGHSVLPLLLLLCLLPFGDSQAQRHIEYRNTQYGFTFSLPEHWIGYSILTTEWQGRENKYDTVIEHGPMIFIRNPQWTSQDPYQDIPILIFTVRQWKSLQRQKFHVGTAAIGPGELGRNSKYVFALPPRYNYAFPREYEEVEEIMRSKPLHGFEP